MERARGGVSFWSILTGVVVAFGAFLLLSSIIGGILSVLGIAEGGIPSGSEAVEAGIGVGIGLVIAQFLSYLWGGYTAGRMARGKGLLNGILVPILAIVVLLVLGAIATVVASNVSGVSAQDAQRVQELGLPLGELADIGTATGIGILVAMLLGGTLGGKLGERWHSKLEEQEIAERTAHEDGRANSSRAPERTETAHNERVDRGSEKDTDTGSRKG
ncbi:MAG: YrzE family protein [Actinomycetota bacterium]|nr:YrzE family protein [Actinomycetota bacterium]